MEMLLLWNVMQTINFSMRYKLVWNIFELCPLVIWTQSVEVILLAFHGKYYLFGHLKLEKIGVPVTLIVQDVLPKVYGRREGTKPWRDVPSDLPKRTISCTWGYPNVMRPSLSWTCTKYKFIRYGLANMLFSAMLFYWSWENELFKCIMKN